MSTRITAREVDRLAEIASEITGRQIERYGAYGATGVVEVLTPSTGTRTLAPLGTTREAAAYLRGMIEAARMIGDAR